MNRTFIAHSPLGDQLEFRSLEGTEQISRLFEFRVRLISQNSSISAKSLLGKDMSVEVDLTTEKGGGGKRFISGQVTQFTYVGRDGDFYLYESILRPWLWHATRRSDFKIFQFKKAPDIIKEVLGKYGFSIEDKLTGTYREWPYIVQYGESDFNFVSRLLELEGGYYYFSHSMGSHTLVLADDIGSHSPLPNGPSTIPYYPESRAAHVHDEDFIDAWVYAEDIASGNFAADDYDFEKPKAILDTRQQLQYDGSHQLVQVRITSEGNAPEQISRYTYDALGRRLKKESTQSSADSTAPDQQPQTNYFGWDGDRLVHTEHVDMQARERRSASFPFSESLAEDPWHPAPLPTVAA